MSQRGFTLIELLIVVAVIGLLVAIGMQVAFFAFDVARQGTSVANMRQVVSAVMQYESVTSGLPAGGLQPVSAIVPVLGTHAGRVNPKDGWGHDLFYEQIAVAGSRNPIRNEMVERNSPERACACTAWMSLPLKR